MMPQLVTVRVGRSVRLWIPVLPVLVLLSPVLLLVVLAAVIGCVAGGVRPGRALNAGWLVFRALSGTQVEIDRGRVGVLVSIR